jgi:hypothetical protein
MTETEHMIELNNCLTTRRWLEQEAKVLYQQALKGEVTEHKAFETVAQLLEQEAKLAQLEKGLLK